VLNVRQRLGEQLLLDAESEGGLADPGRPVNENQRRARWLAEGVTHRSVGCR
jgi:hypothetical protein